MLDKTFGGLSMSKYSYEEKLEAVLRVKNEGISQDDFRVMLERFYPHNDKARHETIEESIILQM